MKNMIIYIQDDNCIIFDKDKIIKNKFTSISDGYIVNRLKFIEEFGSTLKKHKIKSRLFGDEIMVVKNAYFKESDLYLIENIFMELGFIKVNYLDIREILPDDEVIVEINKNYMVIYLEDAIYLSLSYFKDIVKIIECLREWLQPKIIFLGTNELIPKIKIKGIEFYYLEDYESYIINTIKKLKM